MRTSIVQYEETPRLSEFLGELSFSGYRELGFDKVLMVEGPKDVKAIQQLLRLYKKDHQIVLLPLGGDSLINGGSEPQLEEVKRISPNVFALIDSERIGIEHELAENRKAFAAACSRAGVTCHILERCAIENYFPDRAIKAVKGEKYSALKPFQKLKDLPNPWSKEDNWRLAREMTGEDLSGTDLGKFLESL